VPHRFGSRSPEEERKQKQKPKKLFKRPKNKGRFGPKSKIPAFGGGGTEIPAFGGGGADSAAGRREALN